MQRKSLGGIVVTVSAVVSIIALVIIAIGINQVLNQRHDLDELERVVSIRNTVVLPMNSAIDNAVLSAAKMVSAYNQAVANSSVTTQGGDSLAAEIKIIKQHRAEGEVDLRLAVALANKSEDPSVQEDAQQFERVYKALGDAIGKGVEQMQADPRLGALQMKPVEAGANAVEASGDKLVETVKVQLVTVNDQVSQHSREEVRSDGTVLLTMLSIQCLTTFLSGVAMWWVIQLRVVKPVTALAVTVEHLADGQDVDIPYCKDKTEIGLLANSMSAIREMASNLEMTLHDVQMAAEESARIRTALDNVEMPVLITDNDCQIIFANKASKRQMQRMHGNLQSVVPNLRPDQLEGVNIDLFHAHSPGLASTVRNRLQGLTGEYRHRISVANIVIDLVANPVYGEENQRLGTVVEWREITDRVLIEQDIADAVEAASNGDFSTRISEEGKVEFNLAVSRGFNTLLSSLSQAFDEIGQAATALKQGDLGYRMDDSHGGRLGDIARDINAVAETLARVVGRITSIVETVRTAANEISQGSEDLAQRTESQASSVTQTSASMEEISATVRHNSDNAQRADELATRASVSAEQGGGVAGQAVEAMKGIEASSNKITEIVSLMEGIAFQTNLLALNAAVEAARAGEAGKGFAVVAQEVRSLAQRSDEASKEIKSLIAETGNRVENGVTLVRQAGSALDEILVSVRETASIVADIATASKEQTIGVDQVTTAISQMDDAVQQNAALVEESTAAANSLSIQAGELADAVSFFRLPAGAATRGGTAVRSPVLKGASAPVKTVTKAPAAAAMPRAPVAVRASAPASAATRPPVASASAASASASAGGDDEWDEF